MLVREMAPTGSLAIHHNQNGKPFTLGSLLRYPFEGGTPEVRAWRQSNLSNIWRGAQQVLLAQALHIPTHYGSLHIKHLKANGEVIDYGLASLRVVTDVGVGFIVDAWQNSLELEIMKYHGVGTGTTNEAAGDTALVTESTTILTVDSTRATGSLEEGATANIFKSIGTVSFDGAGAITEHGLFSQAATGGGVLFDRSKFSALNVVSGDSLAFTYQLTLTSGS